MRRIVSPQEVTHLWAYARQDYATNPGRSLYFSGDTIYSYGNHFPIARRLGHDLYAFTTRSYSNTTAKHTSMVRQAIPRDATIIYVSDPEMTAGPADRIRYEAMARDELLLAGKPRIRQATRDGHKADALRLAEAFNAYAEAVGSTERIDTAPFIAGDIDAVRELIRRQEDERRRLVAEAEARSAALLADRIAAWKRGDSGVSSYDIRNAPVCLRIEGAWDGDRSTTALIATSRGARIPVADAKRLWPVIQRVRSGKRDYEVGMALGDYRLTKISRDGSIVVGCHDIAYSEIERIAGLLGLVEAAAEAA